VADNKNSSLQSNARFIKPLIIAVIILIIAWVIGKGVLTLGSFAKKM